MDSREIYDNLKPLIDIMTYSDQERHIKFLNQIFSARITDPVQLLKELASEETDDKILSRIVLALGNFSDPRLIDSLTKFLSSPDDRIRANAVEALGKIKDPSVVALLTPMLEDKNNRVVANAAMSLWKFGGLRMLNVLVNLLENGKDDYIKASAAFALGEIGGLQVVAPLMKSINTDNEMLKSNIIKSLGKSGDSTAVDSIIPFLNSGSFKIKQAAVCALGSLENPKACPFLLNLFEDDENENIIEDIKDALLKTLNKKDVAALAQAVLYLKDPRLWVKKTCLQVIAKTAEPSLNQFIEPVTQSPVKELRDLALKIINS